MPAPLGHPVLQPDDTCIGLQPVTHGRLQARVRLVAGGRVLTGSGRAARRYGSPLAGLRPGGLIIAHTRSPICTPPSPRSHLHVQSVSDLEPRNCRDSRGRLPKTRVPSCGSCIVSYDPPPPCAHPAHRTRPLPCFGAPSRAAGPASLCHSATPAVPHRTLGSATPHPRQCHSAPWPPLWHSTSRHRRAGLGSATLLASAPWPSEAYLRLRRPRRPAARRTRDDATL